MNECRPAGDKQKCGVVVGLVDKAPIIKLTFGVVAFRC